MPKAPSYIRVNGYVYKRAALNLRERAALDVLVEEWLKDGWRDLFLSSFMHLSDEVLADRMQDKFGVYIGDLAGEELPWKEYAQALRREKENKNG